MPQLFRNSEPETLGLLRLRVDPQGVRDTVDVVEVASDVHDFEQGSVREPLPSQDVQVGGLHRRRAQRQLGDEVQNCPFLSRQPGRPIFFHDPLYLHLAHSRLTEILPVSLNSVETVIDARYHHCNHLVLGTGQLAFGTHQRTVKAHRVGEKVGCEA